MHEDMFHACATASTMILFSLLAGCQPARQKADRAETRPGSWLRNSQLAIRQLEPEAAGYWRPAWLLGMLGWAVIVLSCYLSFMVFW